MLTLNYGTRPTRAQLRRACSRISPETGEIYFDVESQYRMNLKGKDAKVLYELNRSAELSLSFTELYSMLTDLILLSTDESLDIASSILYTLGVEWI